MNGTKRVGAIFAAALCCAVVATFPFGQFRAVHAQGPVPTAFMHNVTPTFPEPADGAAVLVVEGLGGGLGGCSHRDGLSQQESIDEIVYFTDVNINAHKPTVTEISPQAPCSASILDWKNLVLTIVTRVENDTGSAAATWWGGIMLDEESGAEFGFSPAELEDLNSGVRDLMLMQPGISWYYTETFAAPGTWSQTDFNTVTGISWPAPQIATEHMVALTNTFYQSTSQPIIVTWSTSYPNKYLDSMVYSSGWINGPPFASQWGLTLSNCFIGTICNDWDGDGILNVNDSDGDNDACGDGFEPARGIDRLNPWDFYSVPVPALLLGQPSTRDNGVGVSGDVVALLKYVGKSPTGPEYLADYDQNGVRDGWQYDRSLVNVSGARRPGPPDGGIGITTDVTVMLDEAGWIC